MIHECGGERSIGRQRREEAAAPAPSIANFKVSGVQLPRRHLSSGRKTSGLKLTQSERMACIRKVDTKPELLVRGLLHRLGFRYRLHRRDLPGTPDLVFPARRKIIFVHGCFWHRHDCNNGRKLPSGRHNYWVPKLSRNVERHARDSARLRELGWNVFVVWECELVDMGRLERDLLSFLRGP